MLFLNDCLDILIDVAVFLIRDNHTVPRSANLARYIVQRIAGSGGNADHMRDIILLLHQKVQRSCCKDAAIGPSFQYDCSGFCYAVIFVSFILLHSPIFHNDTLLPAQSNAGADRKIPTRSGPSACFICFPAEHSPLHL